MLNFQEYFSLRDRQVYRHKVLVFIGNASTNQTANGGEKTWILLSSFQSKPTVICIITERITYACSHAMVVIVSAATVIAAVFVVVVALRFFGLVLCKMLTLPH